MADAFATVEDLEARWRGLSEQEHKRAAVLLEDATDLIKSSAPRWQHASLVTLKRIACAVVKRALQAEQGAADGLPEPRGLGNSIRRGRSAINTPTRILRATCSCGLLS